MSDWLTRLSRLAPCASPLDLAFVTSDARGVYAPLPLDKTRLPMMRSANALSLTLATGERDAFKLTAPLRGFAAAYDRISKLE